MDLSVQDVHIPMRTFLKLARFISANGVIIRHPLPQTRSFTKLGHHLKNGSGQSTLSALTREDAQQ